MQWSYSKDKNTSASAPPAAVDSAPIPAPEIPPTPPPGKPPAEPPGDTPEKPPVETSGEPPGKVDVTSKGHKLAGKRLETFERFWRAFGLPKGKAEAAEAWRNIPKLTDALVEQIVLAAEREAAAREQIVAAGKTPKWAQGWLSGRRWEDEPPADTREPPPKTAAEKLREKEMFETLTAEWRNQARRTAP
jgi:hypothetical protein